MAQFLSLRYLSPWYAKWEVLNSNYSKSGLIKPHANNVLLFWSVPSNPSRLVNDSRIPSYIILVTILAGELLDNAIYYSRIVIFGLCSSFVWHSVFILYIRVHHTRYTPVKKRRRCCPTKTSKKQKIYFNRSEIKWYTCPWDMFHKLCINFLWVMYFNVPWKYIVRSISYMQVSMNY